MTADKWMLTEDSSGVKVTRGDHVKRYVLLDGSSSSKPGSLSSAGLAELTTRKKWRDARQPRIVGRQVAYMGKSRRLTFTLVPEGTVVSNSCNYLAVEDPILRMALLGFLNSAPAEWFFRLHNSNNHVSNGEIDDLFSPFDDPDVLRAVSASTSVRTEISAVEDSALAQRIDAIIDALVCYGMGLTAKAARDMLETVLDPSVADEVVSLLGWFSLHGVPDHLKDRASWTQHGLNTLSELDYEMIRHVPVGGNWQQIPESVPSARLSQIRAMSKERGIVRTTYYGRLRPDQPAYTIATYYNRPGNGTNIHPHEDRTLSHREAARLQSFPDSYGFIGGDGAIRKQIGNAVPPLLGRAVASQLLQSGLMRGPIIDLFAGAGACPSVLNWPECQWQLLLTITNPRSEHTHSTARLKHSRTRPQAIRS
ncbi:hypothetical protein CTI14_06395 [Methylobacterium radiotolerans]|nr:hypothetical protein CTI14_06395 [Methylobacterium radiotolerans]